MDKQLVITVAKTVNVYNKSPKHKNEQPDEPTVIEQRRRIYSVETPNVNRFYLALLPGGRVWLSPAGSQLKKALTIIEVSGWYSLGITPGRLELEVKLKTDSWDRLELVIAGILTSHLQYNSCNIVESITRVSRANSV